jgi:hypothetical protein
MADHPVNSGPAPAAPKPLPGPDFSDQPLITETGENLRDPKQPQQQSSPRHNKVERSDHRGDDANETPGGVPGAGEDSHIESAEHVERELPSANVN